MTLLEFPVRRYQFTLVAFMCLLALGIYAFINIPREEDPYFKLGVFFITAIDPGADPQDLERLIVKPIEDRIAALDDVHRIESTAVDGVSLVAVEFEATADPDKKYDEITREVNALRPELPSDMARLEVRRMSPAYVNILQLALVSPNAPYTELEAQARTLRDLLRNVNGVRTSETWAYPTRELRIAVDLARLGAARVTPGQLLQAIQSENANIPAGFVDVGDRSFSLRTSGAYQSLDEVRDTVIGGVAGRSVRVRDVATVSWESAPLSYVGRYNGNRAVFVTASQGDGYNSLELQKRLDTALNGYESALPRHITLARGFDQARNVSARLNRLYRDFGIAVALVALTLLPLGWRAAGIVMVALPLSLAVGIAALYFLGYSLNQISIAGFVLALGLLVDDSIVVVENITRHLREGASRIDAALAGTRQIVVAILGCTATLIFAFLPLLMLPGNSGKFVRVLPATVTATILGSLFIALLIIPFIASRVLPRTGGEQQNVFLQTVMGGIHRYYRPALHYCLSRPRGTTTVALGGSLLLILLITRFIGVSLFPKADTPQFLISVQTPNGTSLSATDRALRFVETELSMRPEVRGYFSNLGHGNPQIYYNHIVRNEASNYAELFVQLKSYNSRSTPAMLDALRARLDDYPGARIEVREFTNGIPISAPVSVRVQGADLVVLESLAETVRKLIESTPGTRDVTNPLRVPRTNLKLQADSQKLGMLGVATVEMDRAVRLAVSGLPAGTYKASDGEQYNIVVRAPIGAHATFEALQQVQVPTQSGALLPLAQLAKPVFERAPTIVQRYQRERAVTVDSQVQRGYNTAKVTNDVVERLNAMDWPRGYRYTLGGEAQSSSESAGIRQLQGDPDCAHRRAARRCRWHADAAAHGQ
jgi:multidrug efflux pump subunit AcrB